MAPSSAKRKRPDRQQSHDDGSARPSPHRPENLPMAQQGQAGPGSNRGRGNGGRRGRGGMAPNGPSRSVSSSVVPPQPFQATTTNDVKMQEPEENLPKVIAATIQPDPTPDESVKTPFDYTHLTNDIVEKWEESGKLSLLETATQMDTLNASVVLQELIRSGLDGRMQPTEAGAFVKDMIAGTKDAEVDVQSLFLDVVSLLEEKDTKRAALFYIITATDIDPEIIRKELDVQLLQYLQLVRSTFDRMRTRKTTNVLYRQANFNLLREESEGYAKLITDYYNANSSVTAEDADPEMAQDAFNRIMALIGAFDLDVGRVLDITLDISANSLVKSYRFLLKFYRCSSWWPQSPVVDNIRWSVDGPDSLPSWALPGSGKWQYEDSERSEIALRRLDRDIKFYNRLREIGMDAFFEIGARRIIDFENALSLLQQEVEPEPDSKGREINIDLRKRTNENRKYMRETKMLPPQGNSDAAQLLGFKLSYYASAARDVDDVLPDNIIYLAALLIKIGFISLRDLYPHLYPLDEDMSKERDRLEKEKEEKERRDRPGGGLNALAMAGALADDTVPAVRNLRNDNKSGGTSPKPEKKDDEKEPDLPPPVNQKMVLLRALLAIGALPEALFILGRFPWLVDLDLTLPPFLHRIANHMLSKVGGLVSPLGGRSDAQDTKSQLTNTVVAADGSVTTAPRPNTRIRKWLGLDGPDNGDGWEERHYYNDWDDNIPICQDIEDFYLLCNTFLNYLGAKVGRNTRLITTMIRLVQHGLDSDASETNQTRWLDLIKRILLPALGLTKHNPAVSEAMFDLLRRFSTTVRYNLYAEWYTGKTSRLPDVKAAFDRNRAEVKDVLRRITNQSGKAQARALAKVALASPGIVMMTFINQLESYSNMIPGLVDSVRYFSPFAYDILTWVLIRSLSGQGRDRMQGDGMLTSPWLQALSQFVASLFTRYGNVNPAPVLQYVASELRTGDSTDLELIDQVVAEMAGVRSDLNFNDTQIISMTGGELLQSQVVQQLADVRHLRKSSAKRLMKALNEPGIVGQILISIAQERQMYADRSSSKYMPLKVLGNNLDKIQQVFAQYLDMLNSSLTPIEFENVIPDVATLVSDFGVEAGIAFTICRKVIAYQIAEADALKKQQLDEEKQKKANTEPTKEKSDTDMVDAERNAAVDLPSSQQNGVVAQEEIEKAPWHPVLEALMQRLVPVTGDLTERVSMSFFVTFWTLSPSDVYVPAPNYNNEVDKLNAQIKEIGKERTDSSATAIKERDRKKTALSDLAKKLTDELSARITVFTTKKLWLNTQKKHWFTQHISDEERMQRHVNLLQECFLPRALLSSVDAFYCFTMLKIIHSNNTPGFSMLSLVEQLMNKATMSSIIFQCTAREAENFGRFLCEVLKQLSHWHSNKLAYEKEALGSQRNLVGFATAFDENGAPTEMLDYEEFRRILFGWHNTLKDTFRTLFESGEYMQIRNGIIVLKSIHVVFPALKFHGKAMQDLVKAISDKDTRGDLKLAALSLQGPLKNREKSWVIPQLFKMAEQKDAEMTDGENEGETSKLDATAPEFKPTGETNGDPKSAEDGEIEDEKPAINNDVKMADAGDDQKVQETKEKEEPKTREVVASTTDVAAKSEGTAKANDKSKPASTKAASRPSRHDEDGRLDKPNGTRAPQTRDRSPGSRGHTRSNDHGPSQPRSRYDDRPPNRPTASDSRSFTGDRDRPYSTQTSQSRPPPRSESQQNSSRDTRNNTNGAPQMSSVVAAPAINPERAALINGDPKSRPSDRKSENEQRGDSAPTGPRNPRSSGGRDLFEQGSTRNNAVDSGRGRLNRDAQSSPQNESYGRLNGAQDLPPIRAPPSGPTRGPRLNARASESNLQTARQDPPTPTRNTRQRNGQERLSVGNAELATPSQNAAESGPAVHPSRMAMLGTGTPSIDTSSPTANPPSGPRSQNRPPLGTPTGPSPTNNNANGPGFGDRQRRNERPRSNAGPTSAVNSVPAGVSFRGAAKQQPSTEQPRAVASSMEPGRNTAQANAAPRIDPGRAGLIQQLERDGRPQDRNSFDQAQTRPSRGSSRERRDEQPRRAYQQEDPQRVAPRRNGRDDDGPPRRPPPMTQPSNGGYQNQPQSNDWNGRGPSRGYENRPMAGQGRSNEDYRGPPRRDDMRAVSGPGGEDGRKRRHEDGPPPFDPSKRRRGDGR